MNIRDAVMAAFKGNAIVFLGAGFSFHARNSFGKELPSSSTLAKELSEEAGVTEDLDLKEAAEEFMEVFGREKLSQKINGTFKIKFTDIDYSPFTKVPWRRVYTTNYDNLVEKVCRDALVDFNSLLISDDPASLIPGAMNCVHINGFVEKMNLLGFKSEFKLTSTSYLSEIFTSSKWRTVFNSDLRESAAIIFVGYSLYDIDVEKILVSDPSLAKKTFFVTGSAPSARLMRKLADYGTIEPLGTDGFIDLIQDVSCVASPSSPDEELISISKVETGSPGKSTTGDDVISLLLYGNRNPDLIAENFFSKKSDYFVLRRKTTDIAYDLKAKGAVVVHSKMANGKSLFLDGVYHHLISKGHTLYKLKDGQAATLAEIEVLRRQNMPVLVIENYHRSIETLKRIRSINLDAIKLLLTCRTELHEIYSENLEEMGLTFEEINLNRLDPASVASFVELLDQNGLFGKSASLKTTEKREVIQGKLGAEVSNVLSLILQAPQIEQRIKDVVASIESSPDKRRVVLLCALAGLLSYDFDMLDLQTILDDANVGSIKYYKDEGLSQLVHYNAASASISLRNPILAQRLIAILVEKNQRAFFDFLVDVYNALDRNSDVDHYFKFARDLSVYSNLKKLFGAKGNDYIIEYFDIIKTKFNNGANQHFWLQFAIARMANSEYDVARTLIETAYSYASKRFRYNKDWIDNQQAHLLIDTAALSEDPSVIVHNLKLAHGLTINQDNHHYPYHVANKYFDIVRDNHSILGGGQIQEITVLMREFNERFDKTVSANGIAGHPVMQKFRREYTRHMERYS